MLQHRHGKYEKTKWDEAGRKRWKLGEKKRQNERSLLSDENAASLGMPVFP